MRQNPERRTTLVDAAIEVLARDGARGLTLRAVDTEAAVPPGTASNYFANRDALLNQAGARVFARLRPSPDDFAVTLTGPRDREHLVRVMCEAVERISEYRSGYLALLELRLEATRRPELRAVLTRTIRADVEANIAGHPASGLPGDTETVVLLYLSLNWLIVERLTLPEVFPEADLPALIRTAVHRALPPEDGPPGAPAEGPPDAGSAGKRRRKRP